MVKAKHKNWTLQQLLLRPFRDPPGWISQPEPGPAHLWGNTTPGQLANVYTHSCTIIPVKKPVPGYETGMDPTGFCATGLLPETAHSLLLLCCHSALPDLFWLFTASLGDKK